MVAALPAEAQGPITNLRGVGLDRGSLLDRAHMMLGVKRFDNNPDTPHPDGKHTVEYATCLKRLTLNTVTQVVDELIKEKNDALDHRREGGPQGA